jgi:hypothetical protein
MRLECIVVPAYLVQVDTFLFLPKKNAFFFVDFKEVDEHNITFIFESGISPKNGQLETSEIHFKFNEEVIVVANYNVDKDELIKEIDEEFKLYKEEI